MGFFRHITCLFVVQTEEEDFTVDTMPPSIDILPGKDRGCLIITIVPSGLVEREETIRLSISSTSPAADITQGVATVLIASDGGTYNVICIHASVM